MVDTIGSVGGYTAPPAVGATSSTPKTQEFSIAQSSQTTPSTGGDAVVPVRYLTPVLVVDPATKIVVYQQLDPETGQVLNQYPSEKAVQQYQKADQQSGAPLTDAKVDKTPTSAVNTIKAAPVPVSAAATADVTTPAPPTSPPKPKTN